MDSSDGFLVGGNKVALAFKALWEGYDVWIGNTRGNKYSRMHAYLDPDNLKDQIKEGKRTFWDFSF
jgi:hypothetical protein